VKKALLPWPSAALDARPCFGFSYFESPAALEARSCAVSISWAAVWHNNLVYRWHIFLVFRFRLGAHPHGELASDGYSLHLQLEFSLQSFPCYTYQRMHSECYLKKEKKDPTPGVDSYFDDSFCCAVRNVTTRVKNFVQRNFVCIHFGFRQKHQVKCNSRLEYFGNSCFKHIIGEVLKAHRTGAV